ncbi:glycosyltransferase [Paenibacillus sp. HJL G12]|uniref:Glycosyltransferase n=1 Tax=Paenibacillus dendrobii TaxID=2691084 RepID=A0A7X3IIK7_9BACL|nr:glycosyltransferase family 4 protein [Paenibacillus dendrobii]MWV42737.1 glycosyltransferase [Paenibacillus dendrobii]
MKVLFTFFNPSGGMETLNRVRSKALMEKGIECHLLYNLDGQGRKNIENIPTFILSDESKIRHLIEREKYTAIVVCTDIKMLERMRNIGYSGVLIYEVQGLGTPEETDFILQNYKLNIERLADALLYPRNPYLTKLLGSYFPNIPQFSFDDPLDSGHFGYIKCPPTSSPIIGWVGRIQQNKNWREFLQIGERLVQLNPEMRLWFFDDDTLAHPNELQSFHQFLSASPLLSARLIRNSSVPHKHMAAYLSMIGDSGGLLISTSIHEGFGYIVAESMLCRCPVLSTNSGGVQRLIYNDLTGKFYTLGNIEEAVQKALSLMIDINHRNWLTQNAEAHIKKHFSTDFYSYQFLEMIKVLSNSS